MSDTVTRRPVGADLILPICAVAYAIYYVYSVREFPFEAQISGLLLAGLLGLLSALYFLRVAIGVARRRYSLAAGAWLGPRASILPRFVFMLLIVAYILAVPWLGFTLTTFAFLAASFLVLGARPIGRAIAVAALAALGGWLFFIMLLGTRFPTGPFEWAVSGLF